MKLDVLAQTLTVSIFFSRLLTKAGARDYFSRSTTKSMIQSLYSHATHDESSEDTLSWDNGALPLVLSVIANNIVSDMSRGDDTVEGLTRTQTERLADQLKGIYANLLDHPALGERRLYVGSQQPEIQPHPRLKRTFPRLGHPVCPERAQWMRLGSAKDPNGTDVVVLQPELDPSYRKQWFYIVNCDEKAFNYRGSAPRPCMGIDHNKYNSFCDTKQNWVHALVRRPSGLEEWSWIHVNSSCTCAIMDRADIPIFEL